MKGKETIQALLDGELVKSPTGIIYRVTEDGVLELRHLYGWRRCSVCFNSLVDVEFEIYDEYPLTFEKALNAMLEGDIVRTKYKPETGNNIYRFRNDKFECTNDDDGWTKDVFFSEAVQNSKWKIED